MRYDIFLITLTILAYSTCIFLISRFKFSMAFLHRSISALYDNSNYSVNCYFISSNSFRETNQDSVCIISSIGWVFFFHILSTLLEVILHLIELAVNPLVNSILIISPFSKGFFHMLLTNPPRGISPFFFSYLM